MSRQLSRASLAVLALAVLACADRGEGRLVRLPPPRGWAEDLAAFRQRKDDQFRKAPDTPLRAQDVAGFAGLEYWAADPRYYFAGDLERYAEPQRFAIRTTAGRERPCERYGRVRFLLDGRLVTLQVYRMLDVAEGEGSLLLPFQDATAGHETYGAGRYLDLAGPPGGPYVLDFNLTYNPSCAYGDVQRFACPVTPAENRLPAVRIEAGERGFVREAD